MDAKHTPGPWRIVEDGGFRGIFHLGTGRKVAAVIGSIREGEHIEANAALIAAAPDLLEALQDALRSVAADVEHYEDQVHHGTYAEAQDDLDEAQELYAKMRAAIAKAEGK